jgi:hypothetical protein
MSTVASIIAAQDKILKFIDHEAKGEGPDGQRQAELARVAVDLIGGLLIDIKRIADAAELANGGK